MPRALPLAATLLLLFGAACSEKDAPATATPTNDRTATPTANVSAAPNTTPANTETGGPSTATSRSLGPAEFQGPRAMDHIRKLTIDIGTRVTGSDGERRAAEYIRDQFAASGYDTEIVPFTFEGDRFRTTSVSSGSGSFDALIMSGSGSGQVRAAALFVGLGDSDGIAGRDLTGRIAIAARGSLQFRQKADNVRRAGAVALIVVNDREGELSGNVGAGTGIPVVGVPQETGVALRAAAESGAPISISVPGGAESTGLNVIARPSKGDACRLVVGGHLDTVPGAPGAHDNGSGTAQTIELARAFAADGLDAGICFIAFGGEESGLHGSEAYVRAARLKNQLPLTMVNIDASGVGRRMQFIGDAALTGQAVAVAQQMGVDADATSLAAGFGSDHQSFAAAGVPVLYFASDELGNFHTPKDTIDTINADLIERGGDVEYAVIRQLLRQLTP